MIYLINKNVYSFCVSDIIKLRKKFNHKICYKKKYQFLNLKHTPTYALTNRLMKKGNFLKTYKLLKNFFYIYFLYKKFKYIPKTSMFIFFFNKFQSFRDLDRVLLWKYLQLDCMFRFKSKKFKKNKKIVNQLYFIKGKQRFILCINYIKYLILLYCKRKNKNMTFNLFLPLSNYLIYEKNSMVSKVKYKVYKEKLKKTEI